MAIRDFITVVSGLPRSGTSLAMQMLHAGGMPAMTDDRRTPDADNPRGYFELERVKQLRTDRAWLDDAVGKAVKIIHLLLMELPTDRRYRVIFMEREMSEVVRSQAVMLERSGKQGGGLAAEQLARVYETQLRTVHQWLAERSCFTVLHVNYASLIRDPASMCETINEFLGGSLESAAMAAAIDPSLYRNRAG